MTTLDLEPIKERLAAATKMPASGVKLPDDDWQTFVNHAPSDLAALLAEVERLRGQIEGLRAIVDSYPNPLECEKHGDDDTVSCGWKLAYTQIVQEIGEGKAE